MRLGLVLLGAGAQAAAHFGVLRELRTRKIEPYVVSGVHAGAWPAALVCAGTDEAGMNRALGQAAWMGERLLDRSLSGTVGYGYMLRGTRMQELLRAQTQGILLSLSEVPGIFVCRSARNGRRILFTSQPFDCEPGAMEMTQATLGFAARAAMTMPPLLAPMEWMGSAMLPETDVALICRQQLLFGAQRVLVVAPQLSGQRKPDAFDILAPTAQWLSPEGMPENVGLLRVPLPEGVGVLSMKAMEACAEAGGRAARDQLDDVFWRMGMEFCRVLPFRAGNPRQASARS